MHEEQQPAAKIISAPGSHITLFQNTDSTIAAVDMVCQKVLTGQPDEITAIVTVLTTPKSELDRPFSRDANEDR